MKKWRIFGCVVLAATTVFVNACGGGGGGGGSGRVEIADAAYDGVRTQAYLDASNAEALVLGAYGGSDASVIIPLALVNPDADGVLTAKFRDPFKLASVFKQIADQVKPDGQVGTLSLLDPAEMCTNYPAGFTSDTLVETVSDSTDTVQGTITYSNCDMGGVIFDGTASLTMSLNLDTFLITSLSMTMNPLQVNDGVDAYTIYGSLSGFETFDNSGFLVSHLTLNITLEDSLGQTFWLNNYKIDDTEQPAGMQGLVSGRFYHNNYGYVDFSTLEPIFIPYIASEPTYDGRLEFAGSQGSHATLWLGVNQADYCINVFNASGVTDLGTCVQ